MEQYIFPKKIVINASPDLLITFFGSI